MAYFRIEFFANALCRHTNFEVFLPNDYRDEIEETLAPVTNTLFLLHGYTGKAGNWVPEELAAKYHCAIVMPTAENSFYQDGEATGRKYSTFVGVELVNYVRRTFGIAKDPEHTFIMGMSMGGFGALSLGMRYPETFGKIAALSSALIHNEVAAMKPGESNSVANYEYYRMCFGDPEQLPTSDKNPEVLARRLADKENKPAIFQCCGTEDFLIQPNRDFHQFLKDIGYAHEYQEAPGVHDMVYWSKMVPIALEWMMGEKR